MSISVYNLDNQKYSLISKSYIDNVITCLKCGKKINVGRKVVSRRVNSGGTNHNMIDGESKSTHTVHYCLICAKELYLI